MPECPPCRPFTSILTASPWNFSVVKVCFAVTSIPPAQPISISSSSSVSRLRRISPVKKLGSKPKAPVIPVSSSMVKSASILGCGISVLSKILMIAATPKPLSAPKVVPFALTQSPSINI